MSPALTPNTLDPLVFRAPAVARYLSLVGTFFIGLATLLLAGFALVLLVQRQWGVGIFIAAIACFMAALVELVWRDLLGKWGLRVALFADHADFDLPAGRSLIHKPPARRLSTPYGAIDAIETRLEGYPSQGMEILQRAYVLALKSGERIFLFEDRALATGLESAMAPRIVTALAERAHIPLRDLGMVEGRGGILSAWGTSAPEWSAKSLDAGQQARVWRRAASTGALAAAVFILIYAVTLLA